MNEQNTPEPKPISKGAQKGTWDRVIEDMQDRDLTGRAKYGTPLQPFNGRNSLLDAYQEALDLVVYLRNEIEERRAWVNRWRVGSKVPINVYEGDRPVCQCHTVEDANRIVRGMNRMVNQEEEG